MIDLKLSEEVRNVWVNKLETVRSQLPGQLQHLLSECLSAEISNPDNDIWGVVYLGEDLLFHREVTVLPRRAQKMVEVSPYYGLPVFVVEDFSGDTVLNLEDNVGKLSQLLTNEQKRDVRRAAQLTKQDDLSIDDVKVLDMELYQSVCTTLINQIPWKQLNLETSQVVSEETDSRVKEFIKQQTALTVEFVIQALLYM